MSPVSDRPVAATERGRRVSETTQNLVDQARLWAEAEIRRVGHGNVPCNLPHGLGAMHPPCREAGVPVGDAAGRPLNYEPVPDSGSEHEVAPIASGSCEPQADVTEVMQCGIEHPSGLACGVRR